MKKGIYRFLWAAMLALPVIKIIRSSKVTVKSHQFKFKSDKQKISVALLADPHLNGRHSRNLLLQAIKIINQQKPDLIFLLGDYVTSHKDDLASLDLFGHLQSKHGIFAILGNHGYALGLPCLRPHPDLAQAITQKLTHQGITVLRNQSQLIEFGKIKFNLVGTDSFTANLTNLDQAFAQIDSSLPTILLSHNPDMLPLLKDHHPTDIIFCGHTHGGLFHLPLIGSFTPWVKLGRLYDKGFKKYQHRRVYISAGLGDNQIPTRLFNPPEISFIEIIL